MTLVAPISALHPRSSKGYRGRFAPSPSGPLHFGSLVAALGSFLRARHQQGEWLVRIEDIDPPREQPGASDLILKTLEAHGLHWDHPVVFQSQRSDAYDQALAYLHERQLSYRCQCTRKAIQQAGGRYPGTCRNKQLQAQDTAIRLYNSLFQNNFQDQLLGEVTLDQAFASEDFILKRRDGLYAYQLAVVVDDIAQEITEIVRGADLLEPTVRQIGLYRQLGAPPCNYLHLPLAVTDQGYKLSKQNRAPALDNTTPQANLLQALTFLNQDPPAELAYASIEELLSWATTHWSLQRVPHTAQAVPTEA